AAELHVVPGEHDHVAAELAHGDIERDARAGRRLVEDHRQHAPGERLCPRGPAALLHRAARIDDRAQLARRNVDQVEEMADRGLAHPAASLAGLRAAACSSAVAARSRRAMPSAITVSSAISGGSSRTTLSPAATASSFSARSASISSPFGTTVRTPT